VNGTTIGVGRALFEQKLNLDYTERHSRPREISTPMSYSADHTRCRSRAGIGKAWRGHSTQRVPSEWCLPGSGAGRKCRQIDGGRDLRSCRAQHVRRGG